MTTPRECIPITESPLKWLDMWICVLQTADKWAQMTKIWCECWSQWTQFGSAYLYQALRPRHITRHYNVLFEI